MVAIFTPKFTYCGETCQNTGIFHLRHSILATSIHQVPAMGMSQPRTAPA